MLFFGSVQAFVTEQLRLAYSLLRTVMFLLFILVIPNVGCSQTYSVIHDFTGSDGFDPGGTLLLDQAGNLYGDTASGGAHGVGSVFKLTPQGGNWILRTLYAFPGMPGGDCGSGGGCPVGGLVKDVSGVLYGVTWGGGTYNNGTVYQLRPSARPPISSLSPWMETSLYSFNPNNGGYRPPNDKLAIDAQGNLYGATEVGGAGNCPGSGCGTVYKLTRTAGGYTYSTIYEFGTGQNYGDGAFPFAGVSVDALGNLYGTTLQGGQHADGSVFELSPSGSGWTETIIYSFTGREDGYGPFQGVTVGPSGELYGTSGLGGPGGGGVVFELSPSNGGWTYASLYALPGAQGPQGGNLTLGPDGTIYGTTLADGISRQGNVFSLTPSNGSWLYISLHDFSCGADGCYPGGGVTRDSSGNLYGTATDGGVQQSSCTGYQNTCGLIWRIAP